MTRFKKNRKKRGHDPIGKHRNKNPSGMHNKYHHPGIYFGKFSTMYFHKLLRNQFRSRTLNPKPIFKKNNKLAGKGMIAEASRVFCPICMDDKPAGEMFQSSSCSHSFCMDCMGTYISTKIRENITGLNCPDPNCRAKLDPSNCSGVVPKEVVERWEDALCEATILASEKIMYCPYSNCSALLLDDDNDDGRPVIDESECPSCHRLFCAKCMVPWLDHDGFSCEDFNGRADDMAAELARSMKWQRCPECNFYVERNEGCNHITCRCGYHFCYGCGDKWTDFARHSNCPIGY